MIDWAASDLATTLGMAKDKVQVVSPYVGGGFGGKLFIRADAVLAALGARAAGRPVKVALSRPMMFNNTPHVRRRCSGCASAPAATARSRRSRTRACPAICRRASRTARSIRPGFSTPARIG
jgi:CO/xanthine dehydrogenase Mo-binding subunit